MNLVFHTRSERALPPTLFYLRIDTYYKSLDLDLARNAMIGEFIQHELKHATSYVPWGFVEKLILAHTKKGWKKKGGGDGRTGGNKTLTLTLLKKISYY